MCYFFNKTAFNGINAPTFIPGSNESAGVNIKQNTLPALLNLIFGPD